MKNSNNIGARGEKLAARYLRKHRYKIVDKNIHASHNEIDLVVRNKEYIVFVEVKTRTVSIDTIACISPASAVTYPKQQRIITAAKTLLTKYKVSQLQPRFDVVEVYLNKDDGKLLHINHIPNAFGA